MFKTVSMTLSLAVYVVEFGGVHLKRRSHVALRKKTAAIKNKKLMKLKKKLKGIRCL